MTIRRRNPSNKLEGQFCRTPEGQRVLVESVGVADSGMPARAIVQYIEGEKKGQRGSYFAKDLKPLGREIPKDENAPSEG